MNTAIYLDALEAYLKAKRFSATTLVHKRLYGGRFLAFLHQQELSVSDCSYTDLLGYVKQLKAAGRSAHNINTHLVAVRQLYASQIALEHLDHNPALHLHVKGRVQRLPHDLLSYEQLEALYRYPPGSTNPLEAIRDQVLLGLCVYQGVTRQDLTLLQTDHINLKTGELTLVGHRKLARRKLSLASCQILVLQEYVSVVRPELQLQSMGDKGCRLFFTYSDQPDISSVLRDLLKRLKASYPYVLRLQQLRSSVIRHWIKTVPIRQVQYWSGHRSISSTERYRLEDLEDLQEGLSKYHPLQ